MAKLLEEDALKIAFALESLDSPDPFAHEAVVPDAVKDAIKCDARDAFASAPRGLYMCSHRWGNERTGAVIIREREAIICEIEKLGSEMK